MLALSHILAWTPGWGEIVVILILVLLLFGGKKIPELARGLARGLKSFKREMSDIEDSMDSGDKPNHVETPPPGELPSRDDAENETDPSANKQA